tara:strand:- start:199 stop:510 length:312 start_codon:yes stop_codon:yes gene_type:complete
MELKNIKISPDMTKEQAILYYLFVDEQLLCAWWDYLDCWNYMDKELRLTKPDPESQKRMNDLFTYVEYWENILDQLKKKISYEDIEDYIKENPHITKSYLFVR